MRRYEFLRDGQRVAHGETEWVYVDAATGRPRRTPELLQSFVLTQDDGDASANLL